MIPETIIIFSSFFSICRSQMANFKVVEESLVDSVIGNIAHLHTPLNRVSYFIHSPLLKVSENGDVLLSRRIDLETICSQFEVCCGEIDCVVKATIIAKDRSSERSETITINLTVLDKNDNWPRFSKHKQVIQVAENEPVGSYLFLEQAHDADVNPINKITHYNFEEITDTFQFDQSRLPSIGLIVKKSLDYEKKNVYHANLEACDVAKQCTSQKLEVIVLDKNDNFPIFEKQDYSIEILENFPIGQQILKVKAIDKDSDKFNQVLYGFHEVQDNNLKLMFIITENTGSIKLQRKLSAKVRQRYEFKVFAVDKMAMASHKAIANILITVKDLNDNSPVITILNGDSRMEIQENELPKELITLQVTDNDIGENANVSCTLLSQSINDFKLKLVSNEIYSLSTTRTFDYEIEKQVKAVIECVDHGIPKNIVQKPLTLFVQDVNEYSPRCEKEFYRIRVLENRPPGEIVFKINGTDNDGSAKIRFSIYGAGGIYFIIHSETGDIKSGSRSLDKESMEKMEITVRVTDGDINPRSGECTIFIEILDENDNNPRFTVDQSRAFFIIENKPIHYKVNGQITATDDDKDEINSKVLFQLLRVFDSRREIIGENLFKVTDSGDIYTLQKLDRETNANYTLEIRAHDTGVPSRSSSTNFTVVIEDENDNLPIWINPKSHNGFIPSLNISANLQPGQVVTKIEAYDPDYEENGRISYSIIGNNKLLFSLNQSTGELRVARILPIGSVQMFFRASDNGYPPMHSEANLVIFISGDEVAALNMSIILVLIGVTGVISVFLIVAIICVRRKPRYDETGGMGSQHSFEQPKAYNVYNTGSWMQNSDEAMCRLGGGLLSDSNSFCYNPNEIESSMPMHTFVSKNSISPPMLSYQNVENSFYSTMVNTSTGYGRMCNHMTNSPMNLIRNPNSACCDLTSTGSIGRCMDIDDDSADSGKGGSEDDTGLHQLPLLNSYSSFDSSGKGRLCSTLPYQNRGHGNSRVGIRARGTLPNTINHCPCYILPEDSVIQSGHDFLINHSCKPSDSIPSSSVENCRLLDSSKTTLLSTTQDCNLPLPNQYIPPDDTNKSSSVFTKSVDINDCIQIQK